MAAVLFRQTRVELCGNAYGFYLKQRGVASRMSSSCAVTLLFGDENWWQVAVAAYRSWSDLRGTFTEGMRVQTQHPTAAEFLILAKAM